MSPPLVVGKSKTRRELVCCRHMRYCELGSTDPRRSKGVLCEWDDGSVGQNYVWRGFLLMISSFFDLHQRRAFFSIARLLHFGLKLNTTINFYASISFWQSVNQEEADADFDRGRLTFPCFFRIQWPSLLARHAVVQNILTSTERNYNKPHKLMLQVMIASKIMKECLI